MSPADSERRTRKRLIDPRLQAAGWKIVRFDASRRLDRRVPLAVEEFPTENGPADYALVVDGQVLGVVEAKKLTLGPQNALTQAERHSRGVAASPWRSWEATASGNPDTRLQYRARGWECWDATSPVTPRRYLPYAFTEQAVAMLSSVLKSARCPGDAPPSLPLSHR